MQQETANVGISGRVAADDLENGQNVHSFGRRDWLLAKQDCSEEARQGKIVRVLPQWHGASASLFFIYPAHRFVHPRCEPS